MDCCCCCAVCLCSCCRCTEPAWGLAPHASLHTRGLARPLVAAWVAPLAQACGPPRVSRPLPSSLSASSPRWTLEPVLEPILTLLPQVMTLLSAQTDPPWQARDPRRLQPHPPQALQQGYHVGGPCPGSTVTSLGMGLGAYLPAQHPLGSGITRRCPSFRAPTTGCQGMPWHHRAPAQGLRASKCTSVLSPALLRCG